MRRETRFGGWAIAALLAVSPMSLTGCKKTGGGGGGEASPQSTPAAPAMPAGWKVVTDVAFAPADIAPVQMRMGGAIEALRNTTYEVAGRRVKVNVIVAATAQDGAKVWAALSKLKPAEFLVRKSETVFYELVGPNAALAEMRQGRAHLAGR